MRSIRNSDGRLVAMLDERTGVIIIRQKGCETQIVRKSDGSYKIVNSKSSA